MSTEVSSGDNPKRWGHDQQYTWFLPLLAVVTIYMINILRGELHEAAVTPERAARNRAVIPLWYCYVVLILGVFAIRIFRWRIRRRPTLFLNVVLLLFFPFGTALGVYGLLRVDKIPPRMT